MLRMALVDGSQKIEKEYKNSKQQETLGISIEMN